MKFNDFDWHDAIIKNIKIDRSNPGILDTVIFEIKWPNNDAIIEFVFEDVYWAKMNLNFGIVANENILGAAEFDENDEDLINFYLKWKGQMDEIKLQAYEIILNSSGGQIKIIAKRFYIKP